MIVVTHKDKSYKLKETEPHYHELLSYLEMREAIGFMLFKKKMEAGYAKHE